jgi:hypothetical protein
MMRDMLTRLGIAALSAAAFASCGASTQLASSWTDPTATNRTYKKIAVVGVTPRAPARRMYEDAFVADLHARSIAATPSYTFAGEGPLDKDAATAKLREIGADAVIVTRLVDQETVETYYPPTYTTVPEAYYGGWHGYYSMGYTYEASPGYVQENKVYRVETNFYDFANDKLIWSGLTESTLSAGDAPETEIKPLIDAIVNDMEKHKILPGRTKS